MFLALVITSSLITRNDWVALEESISEIVGVLTPTQSNLVYLAYGVAILALPFVILVSLIVGQAVEAARRLRGGRRDRRAGAVDHRRRHRGAAVAFRPVASGSTRCLRSSSTTRAGSRCWPRCSPCPGPWLPARWRRWWWALLLAFVPIHLVVSAVVPARSLLGLAVGWFVGALVVLVVGTPALEVPLDGAVRAMARRGFVVSALTVLRPAGAGPLVLSATSETSRRGGDARCTARTSAAAARCASCGASCGCATARPRRCTPRCAAPSSTAR